LNGKNRNNEYNSRFLSEKTLIKYIQDEYYFLYETDINLETAKKTAKIIIMIKACDRIHNLSTMPLEYFKQEKVRSKINETIKYYIPIIIEIF
jgi:(p)ppGpp synthase/HD superfamily hydrolase